MEYYSTVKRNRIVSFTEMWMDLEAVIQKEMSERKNIYIILIFLMHICAIYHFNMLIQICAKIKADVTFNKNIHSPLFLR